MTTSKSAFHNKYSLVKGVARRARQLQSGAPPLSDSKSMKACRVAQEEIREGFVTYVVREHLAKPPSNPSNQRATTLPGSAELPFSNPDALHEQEKLRP